jgi:hypothetical protein
MKHFLEDDRISPLSKHVLNLILKNPNPEIRLTDYLDNPKDELLAALKELEQYGYRKQNSVGLFIHFNITKL